MGGANAALAAIPVTVAGLSPTFFAVATLTGIALGALVKVWPLLDRQKRDGDASLRTDLLKRISDLESELRAERRHCDDRLAAMQAQVDGLHRMIVQHQISTGRAIDLTAMAPKAEEALERVARLRGDDNE
jgi:hypothetical protein